MLHKLLNALFRKPARTGPARFDGRLLDQKRDETFLAMHQAGMFR